MAFREVMEIFFKGLEGTRDFNGKLELKLEKGKRRGEEGRRG